MTDSTNSTNMSVYINFEGKSVEDLIRIRANIVQSGNEIALRAIPLIDWRLRQIEPAAVEARARFWSQREVARHYQETTPGTESETESEEEETESECETESEEEDESEEESEEE